MHFSQKNQIDKVFLLLCVHKKKTLLSLFRGCYELAGVKRKDAREDREFVLFVNKKNQKNFVTCVYRDRCPCNPPAGTAGGWQGHEPCPKQVTKFFLVLFCSQKRTFGLFHNHKLIKDLKFITPSSVASLLVERFCSNQFTRLRSYIHDTKQSSACLPLQQV